ncbi:hypothetical protein [Pannonibacter indicus]|uniref:hypothetical protein n=1 Tax=Pannonibacter indicus TaxID=466044 RepID=UPI0035B3364A
MLARPRQLFADLGSSAIERGLADPRLSQFYEDMRRAGSVAGPELQKHLPYLSLCALPDDSGTAPPIVYAGRLSSQVQLFGSVWSEQPGEALVTPDPELERAAAAGYLSALEAGTYYGYGRTGIRLGGRMHDVAYERLIMPLRPRPDSPVRMLAYFGVILALEPQGPAPA